MRSFSSNFIRVCCTHNKRCVHDRLQAAASTQTPKKSNSSQEAIDSSIQLKSSSKVGNTESSEWHGEFSGKFQNNAQSEIERKLRIISQVCSLYRGLAHKALLSLISSFIFFYGYEVYKHLLKKNHVKLTPSMNVLVASKEELLCLLMLCFSESVTQRNASFKKSLFTSNPN